MCQTLTSKVTCVGALWVHLQLELFFKCLSCSAPPCILFFLFTGGRQSWQIAFTVRTLSSFLRTSHVSARPRNLVQWFFPVNLRFLRSIALKFLIQVGKAIASSFVVFLIIYCLQCLCGKKHQLWWAFLVSLPGRQ